MIERDEPGAGAIFEHLQTPALLVDLDVVDHNIAAMSACLAGRRAKLRPHFKNHRVLSLAQRQIENGAVGLTVARLAHAELLLKAGINSVLVSSEIVEGKAIRRLVELAAVFHTQELLVVVDHPSVMREMARTSEAAHHRLSVLVDIDLGLERTGVVPSQAASLAKEVAGSRLRFRGLFGYEGHVQKLAPGNEKAQVCRETLGRIASVAGQLERSGIPVDIVSTSGTGSLEHAIDVPEITEIQAGSYLLMETGYELAAPAFKTALTVLATVISKTSGRRIVVNAGLKALSAERGMPTVKDCPGLVLRALNAEHGIIDLVDPDNDVEVGDRLEIWVHYGDATVNLHRRMYGVRSGRTEEIFEIEAN